MSDHHRSVSEESSLDQHFQIKTNNQGQNELYIPYWEEQGSTSTQYHHLSEEIKFYKNKCKHLENHLQENHREFTSLNQLFLRSEANEKRLYKESDDLKKMNKELIYDNSQLKQSLDSYSTQSLTNTKKETQLRDKLHKSKEKESQLSNMVEELRRQMQYAQKKSNAKGYPNEQEEKWKKHYNEQISKVEAQWKSAYEQLQQQFDKKTKEIRQKNEEIKVLNKTLNISKEDFDEKLKELANDLQEVRRQLLRCKNLGSDHEKNIKQLKIDIDSLQTKKAELQQQNLQFRFKVKEESNKNQRLQMDVKDLRQQIVELKSRKGNQSLSKESKLKELTQKIIFLEKEINRAKDQNQTISAEMKNKVAENSNLSIELQKLKIRAEKELKAKQAEISQLTQKYGQEIHKVTQQSNIQLLQKQQEITKLNKDIQLYHQQSRQSKRQLNQQRLMLQTLRNTMQQQKQGFKVSNDNLNKRIRQLQKQLQNMSRNDGHHRQSKYKEQMTTLKLIIEQNQAFLSKINGQAQRNRVKYQKQRRQIETQAEQYKIKSVNLQKQKQNMDQQLRQLNILIKKCEQQIKSYENDLKIKFQQSKAQELKILQVQKQINRLKQRPKDDSKDTRQQNKERTKRIQAKLRQKDEQLKELQQKLQELQIKNQEYKSKSKLLQKQNKIKDNQNNKKDKKVRQLQVELEENVSKMDQLQQKLRNEKKELQLLKKQMKNLQGENQGLKTLVNQSQEQSNKINQTNIKEQLQECQLKYNQISQQNRSKDEQINKLRLDLQKSQSRETFANQDIIIKLKDKIKDLEYKIESLQSQKNQERYIKMTHNQEDYNDSSSLEQLRAEYNRQLMALKRLIAYKGHKDDDHKKSQQIRVQYESKIQSIINEYRIMQQEMIMLKDKMANEKSFIGLQSMQTNISMIEQSWRIKLQQIYSQRQILLEKVQLWQRKYQQIRFLYQTKLESKDQTINLLNLKLNNLQLSRNNASHHPYYHR